MICMIKEGRTRQTLRENGNNHAKILVLETLKDYITALNSIWNTRTTPPNKLPAIRGGYIFAKQ